MAFYSGWLAPVAAEDALRRVDSLASPTPCFGLVSRNAPDVARLGSLTTLFEATTACSLLSRTVPLELRSVRADSRPCRSLCCLRRFTRFTPGVNDPSLTLFILVREVFALLDQC